MRIIIDFDNVVAQSNQAFIDIANEKTGSNAKIEDIIDYHFDNIVSEWSRQQQNDVFVSKEFYERLKPFPMVVEMLQKLKDEGHELIICSITHYKAMRLKREWVNRHLGDCIDSVILIDNFKQGDSTVRMNKEVIIGDLILDDHIGNLINNKSKYKILFGDNAYSKGWKGLKANYWNEVYWLVHMINKIEE